MMAVLVWKWENVSVSLIETPQLSWWMAEDVQILQYCQPSLTTEYQELLRPNYSQCLNFLRATGFISSVTLSSAKVICCLSVNDTHNLSIIAIFRQVNVNRLSVQMQLRSCPHHKPELCSPKLMHLYKHQMMMMELWWLLTLSLLWSLGQLQWRNLSLVRRHLSTHSGCCTCALLLVFCLWSCWWSICFSALPCHVLVAEGPKRRMSLTWRTLILMPGLGKDLNMVQGKAVLHSVLHDTVHCTVGIM